jgi:hypothetical protein
MTEDLKPDTLMVFSGKSLQTMINEGGCGNWVLDKDRAVRRTYLVVVRNRYAPWSEDDVPHGVAWFIGTISDVVPAPGDRWLVKIDEYAQLDKQLGWGSRNPITYTRLDQLEIDPAALAWTSFPKPTAAPVRPGAALPTGSEGEKGAGTLETLASVLEQTKVSLADALGLQPYQVEISIRA